MNNVQQYGLSPTFERRFWKKVNKTETCWLWTGSKDKKGYGKISKGASGAGPILAHRASWILNRGPIPADKSVLHNCPSGDNPACVNPDHLFLGDHNDNMADMWSKGRGWSPWQDSPARGDLNGNSRLNWETIRQIRSDCSLGMSGADLAKKYSVSASQISNIIHNKQWVEQ